ncbi:MAG: Rieske (2Fe-2S) protein [Anaerolineae bacterium]|nr:Rieske (2Fe-2S) protein [Anaerolineae bacterium]
MTDTTVPTTTSTLQTRRAFLQTLLGLVAAGWAGWIAQGFLFPAPRVQTGQVKFSIAELPIGGAKRITYEGKPAIVLRDKEGVTAFSLVCTHQGCIVQWREGKQEFYCPCHDGYFDRNGDVIAGPPPMPLEQFPAKIIGNEVVVGEA